MFGEMTFKPGRWHRTGGCEFCAGEIAVTRWGPDALAKVTEIKTNYGAIPVRAKRVEVTCVSCGMSAPEMEFERLTPPTFDDSWKTKLEGLTKFSGKLSGTLVRDG